jgi:hypothetical protein
MSKPTVDDATVDLLEDNCQNLNTYTLRDRVELHVLELQLVG